MATMEDDPFAVGSPSILTTALPPTSTSDSPPLPPQFLPPPLSSTLANVMNGRRDDRDPSDILGDSRSPFQTEPLDSVYLNSRPQQQSRPTTSSFLPPAAASRHTFSNTKRMFGGATGGGVGSSSTNSGILGNKSLMGLLGGTRYEPRGFSSDYRDIDEEEIMTGGGGEERRLLASELQDLPPPPSAMSPSSSTSGEEEPEEEDDEEEDLDHPPTFTLSSSHRRPRPYSVSPTASATSARHSNGLHLGGGGILGGNNKSGKGKGKRGAMGMNAKERALWRWINVDDLDGFLQECYLYYVGRGIWAIGLSRGLNLLTVGWVISFSTFLMGCIDYSRLWTSHHLSDVVVDRCFSRFSGLTLLLVLSFSSFYVWRVIRFGMGVRKLWEMHEFYAELLEIPENDIQTIPWHAIVIRLSTLRASHPSALSSVRSTSSTTTPVSRLDAHDVANRIMREENYLIALFNKDVLDLSIPVPVALRERGWGNGDRNGMLTRTLEWNLSFCLIGYLFGRDGQVRRAFVSERNKQELVAGLRRRFALMGLINALFAPFIVLYLLMYSFFRYFEEYHKNPSSIGSRQFTPLARWQFREFNELPHLFQQRLNRAHPISSQYINQFPKEKTALLSNFVAFLAGSFAAVLILFSIIDPDAFLHFEITPGRTVLFYIGVTGTILAVARGMVPDENRVVDPEELMKAIVEETHYLPVEWRGKLHSATVHTAFGQLFQMKISTFVQEVLSVITTPFILWYTLPDCAPAVIDFFREFTVHVDGLGYVCSFAVFDFKRHGDVRFGAPVAIEDDRRRSNEGKMEKSFLNFTAHHPTWTPNDETGRGQYQSLFLSKMVDASVSAPNSAAPGGLHSSTAQMHHRQRMNPARSPTRSMRFGAGTPFNDLLEEESTSSALHHHQHPSLQQHQHNVNIIGRGGGGGGARERYNKSALVNSSLISPPLHSASSRFVSRTIGVNATSMLRSPIEASSEMELQASERGVIEEDSTLDGDSFVAPTRDRPFGNDMDEDDNGRDSGTMGEIADDFGRTRGGAGVMGLLGEVYRTQ